MSLVIGIVMVTVFVWQGAIHARNYASTPTPFHLENAYAFALLTIAMAIFSTGLWITDALKVGGIK